MNIDIASVKSGRVCYMILPMRPKEAELRWMEAQAERFSCSLIAISGVSWDNDLTPWEAPDIGNSKRMLKGRGAEFLERLRTEILPSVEESLPAPVERRSLLGISLSGLFAIWAAFRCEDFSRIGSVSGSLWYDGFTEWLASAPLSEVERFYLSLGDRERFSKDARVATVEERTLETVALLQERGFDVRFEMNPGTHFAPMYPRLEKALAALM